MSFGDSELYHKVVGYGFWCYLWRQEGENITFIQDKKLLSTPIWEGLRDGNEDAALLSPSQYLANFKLPLTDFYPPKGGYIIKRLSNPWAQSNKFILIVGGDLAGIIKGMTNFIKFLQVD